MIEQIDRIEATYRMAEDASEMGGSWSRCRWAFAAALGVLLIGCSAPETGSPRPQAGPAPASGPSISRPLDLAAVAGNPCALLTQAQLDAISPGLVVEPDESAWGEPACVWQNDELRFRVAPQTTRGQGIDDTLRKDGYTPSEVAGYPAARAQEVPGQACSLTVGVNDTAELVLTYQRRAGRTAAQVQPCPYVESIAAKVIREPAAGPVTARSRAVEVSRSPSA